MEKKDFNCLLRYVNVYLMEIPCLNKVTLPYLTYIKQIDSMLPCVCLVIDQIRHQNVVRTSVTHSVIAWCATFFVLTTF